LAWDPGIIHRGGQHIAGFIARSDFAREERKKAAGMKYLENRTAGASSWFELPD
jgi:hypothetical protein